MGHLARWASQGKPWRAFTPSLVSTPAFQGPDCLRDCVNPHKPRHLSPSSTQALHVGRYARILAYTDAERGRTTMPELPEVEYLARQLREALIGSRIMRVDVLWPRAVSRMTPEELIARLTGRRVLAVGRRAKYLVLTLDSGESLVIHRRMSGNLRLARAARRRHIPVSRSPSAMAVSYSSPTHVSSGVSPWPPPKNCQRSLVGSAQSHWTLNSRPMCWRSGSPGAIALSRQHCLTNRWWQAWAISTPMRRSIAPKFIRYGRRRR